MVDRTPSAEMVAHFTAVRARRAAARSRVSHPTCGEACQRRCQRSYGARDGQDMDLGSRWPEGKGRSHTRLASTTNAATRNACVRPPAVEMPSGRKPYMYMYMCACLCFTFSAHRHGCAPQVRRARATPLQVSRTMAGGSGLKMSGRELDGRPLPTYLFE